MNKEDLLRSIADTAYNVGFGAKKHFATYDIVEKAPGFISFSSMAVGVFALFVDALSAKPLSAIFIVLGIVGLYISFYNPQKGNYENAGVEITKVFNELKALYFRAKADSTQDTSLFLQELSGLEGRFYSQAISKQILFSDWYAHYKFFWQHQIDWIDEQKNFKLLRDKLPLSFMVVVVIGLVVTIVLGTEVVPSACELIIKEANND